MKYLDSCEFEKVDPLAFILQLTSFQNPVFYFGFNLLNSVHKSESIDSLNSDEDLLCRAEATVTRKSRLSLSVIQTLYIDAVETKNNSSISIRMHSQ